MSVVLLLLLLRDDGAVVRLVDLRRGDVVIRVLQVAVALRPGRARRVRLAVIHVRQARAGGQSVPRACPVRP